MLFKGLASAGRLGPESPIAEVKIIWGETNGLQNLTGSMHKINAIDGSLKTGAFIHA
jgi:hypothetical protein